MKNSIELFNFVRKPFCNPRVLKSLFRFKSFAGLPDEQFENEIIKASVFAICIFQSFLDGLHASLYIFERREKIMF